MDRIDKIGYRYNVVDIHSHVLPGCDDGSGSMTESIRMMLAAREEGIRDLIATPHFGIENGYEPEYGKVREAFNELKKKAEECDELSGFRLYLGEEVYCSDDASERIREGRACTINDTRFVLVEFLEYGSKHESGEVMLERLAKMKKQGFLPILAHAERYWSLQCNRDYLKKIQDLGVLLQVNAYDLAESKHQVTRELAQWLAKEKMISFIGSDMHGMPPKRVPKMQSGVDWLYENTNEEYADAVVRKNAEDKLRTRKYSPWESDDYYMTPGLAAIFEDSLHGRIVRCQVFPAKANHNISRTVVELEDGRAYAIVDGIMGPRIFQMEAYADDSNSEFKDDDTGWYWLWKGSGKPVELKNLGGIEW